MLRSLSIAVSTVAAFAFAGPSAAAVTQIMSPHLGYVGATNLLGVPNPSGPDVAMVGDLSLVVSFSSALDPRVVGAGWATWGSPPETEDATPSLFFTRSAQSVTFDFSRRLSIWGFEAQGNPFDNRTFTVQYFDGPTLVGSIVRVINGNGGARLLAASHAGGFTRATVSTNTNFAMAQLRYELAPPIPEPATWAMMIIGFGAVGLVARRRNRGLAVRTA